MNDFQNKQDHDAKEQLDLLLQLYNQNKGYEFGYEEQLKLVHRTSGCESFKSNDVTVVNTFG
jgi:hypothetical protein